VRRMGVGRLLMESVEAWARAKGLPRIVLHMRVDRDEARFFYEQLGYQRIATSRLMSKPLESA
jgi:ribosomal protein S18 acetylase RimI-like enzyme